MQEPCQKKTPLTWDKMVLNKTKYAEYDKVVDLSKHFLQN